MTDNIAVSSGTFEIGGDLPVVRLGYGAMQLPGEGVWGPAKDHDDRDGACCAGPSSSGSPSSTPPTPTARRPPSSCSRTRCTRTPTTSSSRPRPGSPGRARASGPSSASRRTSASSASSACAASASRRIDLYQLHRIDTNFPLEDQIGEFKALQDEGKVRHIGLSEVSVDQIKAAREIAEIATVQNLYNLANRSSEDVLDYCEAEGIGFIPWFPLATGELSKDDGPLADASREHGATPSQLALAWLLRRSPVMLPIPGTSSVEHLESEHRGGRHRADRRGVRRAVGARLTRGFEARR